ncbi:MAG: hypothetical protein Ta2B_23130 [Termitinemataceae bacterium]|nr:MAG: hypothetical protein Ta2B_23130 [Termitinemataceae bacterium]
MNQTSYDKYKDICDDFKKIITKLNKELPNLKNTLQTMANEKETLPYTVKCPVVYNESLDAVTKDTEIKLILIGDNPGKKEQETSRYLIGQSGKIAEGFFKKQPDLGIDFRQNVIILNKTPVHTPRTADLKKLIMQTGKLTQEVRSGQTLADKNIFDCINQSEKEMARLLKEIWTVLKVPVWITGYSEMKRKGLFETYTNELCSIFKAERDFCASDTDKSQLFENNVFVFRHFSMNQFTIDLNQKKLAGETVAQCLRRIGTAYRERIFNYFAVEEKL